jgi:hypothetical protein
VEFWWWIAPGLAVIAVSLALTIVHLVSLIARRPQFRLAILALWLRQVGIGILFLGLGARFAVPALLNGPDVGLVVFGALIAGFGGLFFIAATDPMFSGGPILGLPLAKSKSVPDDRVDPGPRRPSS